MWSSNKGATVLIFYCSSAKIAASVCVRVRECVYVCVYVLLNYYLPSVVLCGRYIVSAGVDGML